MKEPELEDFGITPEEYALYTGTADYRSRWPAILVTILSVLVSVPVGLVAYREGGSVVGEGLLLGLLIFGIAFCVLWVVIGIPAALIHWAIAWAITRSKRSRLLASPIAYRIRQYEETLAAFPAMQAEAKAEAEKARQEAEKAHWEAEARQRILQRRREEEQKKYYDYWVSLRGEEFERQLATLFRTMDYEVRLTPTSGDQGVDLILWKDGKTTVVQCKGQKSPVGPAVVRELFGSMHAFRADRAILACTGGFTRGVKEFAKSKPIDLIAANEMAKLARGIGGNVRYHSQ